MRLVHPTRRRSYWAEMSAFAASMSVCRASLRVPQFLLHENRYNSPDGIAHREPMDRLVATKSERCIAGPRPPKDVRAIDLIRRSHLGCPSNVNYTVLDILYPRLVVWELGVVFPCKELIFLGRRAWSVVIGEL